MGNAAAQPVTEENSGELSLDFLKKFITYARVNCAPRLSDKASQKLINNYVKMRNPVKEFDERTNSMF
jgi:DNA replication licensing factor MCM5